MTVDQSNPEVILVAGGLVAPALAAEAARFVSPEDFEDKRLKLVWSALLGMIDSGAKPEEIDVISVAHKCAKTPVVQKQISVFCAEVLDAFPRTGSLVNSANRVHRRATMRLALAEMRSIAEDIKLQLGASDGEVDDLDGRMARLSVAISKRSDTTLVRTVYPDMAQEVSKYFDELSQFGPSPNAVATGIVRLDRRLGGGLRRGQLHSLLGCTGSGKTAFASQVCDSAVAHGHRALMFSMEVDPVDIYIRDVERAAGRSRWEMRSNLVAMREAAQGAIVGAQAALLNGGPGKVVYGEPISVEGIRQAVLTERLRGGAVSVVAVDHAQVALPNKNERHGMPRYLEVKSTAEGLRALARHLNVAVLLTAQMNPPPKGEPPSMAYVREGKDIVNCSEVVLMIWHEKEESADGDVTFTQSWVYVPKARAGQEGKVSIRYRGDVFKFEDADLHEQESQEGQ